MDDTTLRLRLKRLRAAAGLSQTTLAEKIGLPGPSTVSKVEAGQRTLSATEFARWCSACGVSTDDVLSGALVSVSLDPPPEQAAS